MKRINQKSFQQAGVIITSNNRIIPYYEGEDPIMIAAKVLKEPGASVTNILACFDPIEFGRDYCVSLSLDSFSEEFMNCLRTGFLNVDQYGFNRYMNKGLYA